MRVLSSIILFSLTSLAVINSPGCGSSDTDADPFDSLQACFDDHHGTEGLSVPQSIVICCIDHPIGTAGANTVCGDTAASCSAYVTANVKAADAPAADVAAGCADYVTQRAK